MNLRNLNIIRIVFKPSPDFEISHFYNLVENMPPTMRGS